MRLFEELPTSTIMSGMTEAYVEMYRLQFSFLEIFLITVILRNQVLNRRYLFGIVKHVDWFCCNKAPAI